MLVDVPQQPQSSSRQRQRSKLIFQTLRCAIQSPIQIASCNQQQVLIRRSARGESALPCGRPGRAVKFGTEAGKEPIDLSPNAPGPGEEIVCCFLDWIGRNTIEGGPLHWSNEPKPHRN
jgi:hypothetical protein